MAEIRRLEPLTDLIVFELEPTPLLSEPTMRLRLRYLDSLEAADEYVRNELRLPLATAELALRAVAEWDLTDGGKPIPVTDAAKAKYLRPLLGLLIKAEPEAEGDEGEEPRKVLAYEIVRAARDLGNFRKN